MFGLEFIRKLKTCIWKFNPGVTNDDKIHIGFIAQDVNEIVDFDEYSFVGKTGKYYNINYHEFIGPIVKSIQEIDVKLDKIEKRLEKLENDKNETNSNNS